jgi:hypothetical protein
VKQWIPTEYNNVYIDKEDFIYGTIRTFNSNKLMGDIEGMLFNVNGNDMKQMAESFIDTLIRMTQISISNPGELDLVRKLNMKGEDILMRAGYYPVVGDLDFWRDSNNLPDPKLGPSRFNDIVVFDNNAYAVLDNNRCRIFVYDSFGILLFAFGRSGRAAGLMDNPTAIEKLGDRLVVSDALKNIVIVYKPTDFAETVYAAMDAYEIGDYETSREHWLQSVRLSSNFEAGYVGVGRSLLRTGRYEEAMYYFRMGEYRQGYDKAFEMRRQDILREVLSYVIIGLAVIFAVSTAYKIRKRRKDGGYEG